MKDQKRSGWNGEATYSSDIPYGDAGYGLPGRPSTWRADSTLPPGPVRAVECVLDGGRPRPDQKEILASPAKEPRRSRTRS